LKLRPPTNPGVPRECVRPLHLSRHQRPDQPSSATVSRLRPFARRRLRTIRPFLVAIRTRKPWAFFRRRVLGW
jgi:hypothetical protein